MARPKKSDQVVEESSTDTVVTQVEENVTMDSIAASLVELRNGNFQVVRIPFNKDTLALGNAEVVLDTPYLSDAEERLKILVGNEILI